MMVFKRKQIVVLSLVLMIVVAGYLQYSYKKSSVSMDDKENGKLGESVYVDNKVDSNVDSNVDSAADSNVNDIVNSKKAVEEKAASKQANDYFAQAKLDRDLTISKNSDALKVIIEDVNASEDIKAQAYEQMLNIVDESQNEMKIETLVEEKMLNDVIALFGDDGSLDIVVKSSSLTAAQIVQISDIASRQANIDIEKIHVRNIY